MELSLYALRIYLAWKYTPCVWPSTSKIDALGYQLDFVNYALRRYYTEGAIRLMLADDVGLGKTVMTGLLLRELMLRGHVKKVLLVVPRFLTFQWRRELQEKFDIQCCEYGRDNCDYAECAVASLDWAKRHVKKLKAEEWDMVVFDEAHNLTKPRGRKTTQRYQAAELLTSSIKNVLLLTATPHHGDKQDFLARMKLLDKSIDEGELRRAVKNYVVRRLREEVKDETGIPDRHVAPPVEVELTDREKDFYKGIEEYARQYYELGKKNKNLALVAIVFLKRASSSIAAALKTLERRKTALEKILKGEAPTKEKEDILYAVIDRDPAYIRKEIEKIEKLIALGKTIQNDTKLATLQQIIQNHKGDKTIVFTQYRDTMKYIATHLAKKGLRVVELHGAMDEEERKTAEKIFKEQGDVLVATDAASEGLNLQVANILINYDLPWNPSRIDQRIGRVHRYGQKKDVFIYNIVVKDTIDGHIYQVLLRKIKEIERDIGKTFDYLGQALDQRAFMNILKKVLEGASPEPMIEKTLTRKTHTQLENLLSQERIRIERDPRCNDYVTEDELKTLTLSTLAQLDPHSYQEDGECIRVKYVPPQLQSYCEGPCTTGPASFTQTTKCPEKITVEHPLAQAVIKYHLAHLPPALQIETDKPCLSLGTTWIYRGTTKLTLPTGEREVVEVGAYFQPGATPEGCNVNPWTGLGILTLPAYARPDTDPPPLPEEAKKEIEQRLAEKAENICRKYQDAITQEYFEKIKELERKKSIPPHQAEKTKEQLKHQLFATLREIQERCENLKPQIEIITTLRHYPIGYTALGLDFAEKILTQGREGEEIAIQVEKQRGCEIRDLRDKPMAGVDFISICQDEVKYIEVKTVKGPHSEIHIQPIEWSFMCAQRKQIPHLEYKIRLKENTYLYIVDTQTHTIKIYKNPCDQLKNIIDKYKREQIKYVIPYHALSYLKPTEEIKYDS